MKMRRVCLTTGVLVVLSLALLAASTAAHPRRKKIRVNCPDRCEVCVTSRVVCHNTHYNNTDMFMSLNTNFYDKLDTLSVRGNTFGNISGSNLFGFGQTATHKLLTKVDLSGNHITGIDVTTVMGMPSVEELDLSNNQIRQIGGDLLGGMPNLKRVNLTNAFDSLRLDPAQTAEMVHSLFFGGGGNHSSRNLFVELGNIQLAGNGLTRLNADTFCSLPALETLNLSNNSLSAFRIQAHCLPVIRELDLSDNNIRSITKHTVETFDTELLHLDEVDLSGNPFSCDCHLQALVHWFFNDRHIFVNKRDTVCQHAIPQEYEGKSLIDVDYTRLSCAADDGTAYLHRVYIFVSLSLIGLIMVIACCCYQSRGALIKRLDSARGGGRYRVIGGYSKLSPDEVEVRPEFV